MDHIFFNLFYLSEKRNTTGEERLYLAPGCSAYKLVTELCKELAADMKEVPTLVDGIKCGVMNSKENVGLGELVTSPLSSLTSIPDNHVVTVYFRNPTYHEDYIFMAHKLEGAIEPTRVLKGGDGDQNRSYRPVIGK